MINIPDNVYKIFIGIGLIALAFSYLALEESTKRYNTNFREFSMQRDVVNEKTDNLNVERAKHKKMAGRLSKKHNLANPLDRKDTSDVFDDLTVSSEKAHVSDSLFSLYLAYEASNKLLGTQRKKLARLKAYLADAEEEHNSGVSRLRLIWIGGGILFFAGLMGLIMQESDDDRMKYFQANGQRKHYTRCQSCGKKFSAMITCGTHEDGSYNSAFCRLCFGKGKFTEPELTKEELWKRIKAGTRTGKTLPVRKRIIDKLDRWKANLYS